MLLRVLRHLVNRNNKKKKKAHPRGIYKEVHCKCWDVTTCREIRAVRPPQVRNKNLEGYITGELINGKGLHNGLICHASKGIQFVLKFENYQGVPGRAITIL